MGTVRGSGLSWTLEGRSLDLAHLCSSLHVILSLVPGILTIALVAQDEVEILCSHYLSACYEEHAGLGLTGLLLQVLVTLGSHCSSLSFSFSVGKKEHCLSSSLFLML